jgi:pullulanase
MTRRRTGWQQITKWLYTSCLPPGRASGGELERGVGTFQDVLALIEPAAEGGNFADLSVLSAGRSYLGDLGVNTIELLPPEDSALSREWGYATTNFFAPDFDLGFPEENTSPTAHSDLVALMRALHQNGVRVFADMVMAFWRHGPYEHIDSVDFHMFDPASHRDDPDALTSTRGYGRKEVRDGFGSTLIRFARFVHTYDPVSGASASLSPAQQFLLAHLEHWMREYHIDGVRMDSVENVANWDFVGNFTNRGRDLWRERWNAQGLGSDPDSRFLVVGEELSLPMDLLRQNRLDALWNDRFREHIRAALVAQNARQRELRMDDSEGDRLQGLRLRRWSAGGELPDVARCRGLPQGALVELLQRVWRGRHRAAEEANQIGVRVPVDRRRHPDDSRRRRIR